VTSIHVAVASLHLVLGHGVSTLVYRLRFGASPLVVYRAARSPHRTWSRVAGVAAGVWAIAVIAATYSSTFVASSLGRARLAIPPAAAWTLALAGLALMLTAQVSMGSGFRVGQDPRDPPAILRTGGLHRGCRNPIYVGSWLALVGMTMWHPSIVAIGACLGAGYAMHRLVVAEEAFLRTCFGATFTDYCARVRRYGIV
jgi:protein-S-isoprenylcysteine O-methyltransferase Ste14